MARAFAVGAAVLLGTHRLMPPGLLRGGLYIAIILLSALVAAVGIRRNRPDHRRVWWLLVAAIALSGAASLLWEVLQATGRPPTAAHAVFLLAYVVALAGVNALAKAYTTHDRLGALLDATIITTGAGILLWVFVAQPLWEGSTEQGLARLAVAGYPLLNLALLTVILRLSFGTSARVPAYWALCGGLSLLLLSDLVEAAHMLRGSGLLPLVHTSRLAGFLTLGAVPLHPSVRHLASPPTGQRFRLGPARLAALWCASTAVPVALYLRTGVETAVISIGSVALFSLVVFRMWGLLRVLALALHREHDDRFRALAVDSEDTIVIIDRNEHLSFVSPSGERLWGHEVGWLLEQRLEIVHPDDRAHVLACIRKVRAQPPGTRLRCQGRAMHVDGRWRRFDATMVNRDDNPAIAGIVITVRDITARWELEQQLIHQAFHDPLTGLPNRALLADRIAQTLSARREDGSFAVVLHLDIDDFRTVNDSLGHAAGDRILQTVGARIRAVLRPTDTVARLGGDEFAVLLTHATRLDDVTALATRVLDAVQQPVDLGTRRLEPRASVGVALSREGVDAETLLREADTAMHAAKGDADSAFRMFNPAMHDQAVLRLQLKSDLAAALDDDQLTLVYQPITSLADRRLSSLEALVRWEHPTRGAIPPEEFIALAEQTGLIGRLGELVLRRACHDTAIFRRRTGTAVAASVNLSGVQLRDPDLPRLVSDALADSGLPASALILEVTESVLLEESAHVREAFRALRALGVRIAIDDFGTGYCSLSYLGTFPFDIIKIDRSFLEMLSRDDADHRLMVGILDLIASLDVPAVAEGVETMEQLEVLRRHGCAYGQGYLFSRPRPLTELLGPTVPAAAGSRPAAAVAAQTS